MKQLTIHILSFLILAQLQSCIPPSQDKIQKLDEPDISLLDSFDIDLKGIINYQFYQKYGFADIEEQLILVLKPEDVDFLDAQLPLDSADLDELEKIDLRKFNKDQAINFYPERTIQADIRLAAKEYDANLEKSVYHNQGRYKIVKTDVLETIYVYDNQSDLMYIESKK